MCCDVVSLSLSVLKSDSEHDSSSGDIPRMFRLERNCIRIGFQVMVLYSLYSGSNRTEM